MKGPFLRLRYDLHREWECQTCHARVNTFGTVTTQMCDCGVKEGGKRVSMRMVGDGLRRMRLPFETEGFELASRTSGRADADSSSSKQD